MAGATCSRQLGGCYIPTIKRPLLNHEYFRKDSIFTIMRSRALNP
jgi:hypothetical protein